MDHYLFQTNDAPWLGDHHLQPNFHLSHEDALHNMNIGVGGESSGSAYSADDEPRTLAPLLNCTSSQVEQFMSQDPGTGVDNYERPTLADIGMEEFSFSASPDKPSIVKLTNPIVCTGRNIEKDDNEIRQNVNNAERKKFSRFREKNFICDLCCRTFTLLQNLANHAFLYHHPRNASSKSLRQLAAHYKCTKCDKVFHNEDRAMAHEQKAHSQQQPVAEVVHNCTECSKVYSSRSLLKEHIVAVHQQQRPYVCNQCQQSFGRPGGLRRHVQTVHENLTFSCPYEDCDHPAYKCNKALQAHIRARHTGERPFKCLFCEKAFVRRNDLRVHETKHSIETKFRCEHCGLTLRREASLRNHVLRCEARSMLKIKFTQRPKKAKNLESEERAQEQLEEMNEENGKMSGDDDFGDDSSMRSEETEIEENVEKDYEDSEAKEGELCEAMLGNDVPTEDSTREEPSSHNDNVDSITSGPEESDDSGSPAKKSGRSATEVIVKLEEESRNQEPAPTRKRSKRKAKGPEVIPARAQPTRRSTRNSTKSRN